MTAGPRTVSIQQAFEQGVAHHQGGRLAEAEGIYRKVLGQQPGHSDALHLLGVIAMQAGQNEQALDLIARAISLNPLVAEYHSNFGLVLSATGKYCEALAAYRKALGLRSDLVDAHNHRGSALFALGRAADSIAAYRQALSLRDDYADAWDNLGCALLVDNQTEQAIEAHHRAISLRPGNAKAHNNLAIALAQNQKYAPAFAEFQTALTLGPNSAEIYYNLGNTLLDVGRIDESIAAYDQSLFLQPQDRLAATNRLRAFHFQPDFAPGKIFQEHLAWNQNFAAALSRDIPEHRNTPQSNRRLRIGYVSPDFREHSVAHFMENLLAHHNRDDFEIFCYADVHHSDATSARLQSLAARWRDLSGISDDQANDLIRDDQIDILIDLAGHTARNRLLLFARKPAPIQITYLGYPDTTGLSTMDYRLTDALADPPGETEQFHTEKLLRLPESFLCFTPPKEIGGVPLLPAKKNGHITFGCFNILSKINAPLVSWWCRILQGVPESRMLLKTSGLADESVRSRLLEMFQAGGIGPDRIEFKDWTQSRAEHLALYEQIDIALDTFPYHGTTITCEALCKCVPVITLAGRMHVSRVGVSLLSNVGLKKFVAQSPEEYVDLAIQKAGDLPGLARTRTGLRKKLAASVLTDGKKFAAQVEAIYRKVWQDWCQR